MQLSSDRTELSISADRMEEPNRQASVEAGDAANGQLASVDAANETLDSGDVANEQQRDIEGQPEGPKKLSPPLSEQQAPQEGLHPQHPLPTSGHAQDAVICVNRGDVSEEISDAGLTTARAEELLAVFGPNAVKPKQVKHYEVIRVPAKPV